MLFVNVDRRFVSPEYNVGASIPRTFWRPLFVGHVCVYGSSDIGGTRVLGSRNSQRSAASEGRPARRVQHWMNRTRNGEDLGVIDSCNSSLPPLADLVHCFDVASWPNRVTAFSGFFKLASKNKKLESHFYGGLRSRDSTGPFVLLRLGRVPVVSMPRRRPHSTCAG